MEKNKLRFKDIIADSCYLKKNNGDMIIFCSGLPGTSSYSDIAQKYAEKGFIFIHPKYIGSWESYGKFSIPACKDTIVNFVNAIKVGNVKTIFNQEFNQKPKRIFLIGHSFGGSVALSAGAELDVEGIVVLAPVIDYKVHAKNNYGGEENLNGLYDFMRAGFENVYRNMNKGEWDNFCETGLNINPVDYLDKLKLKKIFLIHGIKDNSVNFNCSRIFYETLSKIGGDVTYEETADDHSSIKLNSFENIISWIK
jgi:esterase/lipase